jgi:hypothetical protein
MKKEYIIGAAALVGVVVVYNFLRKPRKNSDGFFSADGFGRSRGTVRANCGRRNADGSFSYYYDMDGVCNSGYKRVAYFGDRNI